MSSVDLCFTGYPWTDDPPWRIYPIMIRLPNL